MALTSFFGHQAQSQIAPASRVTRPIDETQRVSLHGSRSPLAQAIQDQGAVASDFPAGHMILMLQRSAAQEAGLQQFLGAVQNSASPQYHQYLTPVQFGQTYGVSDADLAAVSGWLVGRGFKIDRVGSGRTEIQFSGTAGQVQASFHTGIHSYVAGGEQHYANASDPEIPASLSPVVSGVILNNFGPQPMYHGGDKATLDRVSHAATPLYNLPSPNYDGCLNGYCFAVTPGDFATIYDTKPLLSSGIDGTGVTIGIVGVSNIDTSIVQRYRQNFLPAYSATNLPNVIIDGVDPGTENQDYAVEAYVDVEMAGSVAPNATVNFYAAANSYVSSGLGLAIARALDDNQVSILSVSFGECEAFLGATYNQFYAGLFEQAAAQGITVLVSSGDTGSASCDPPYAVSIIGPAQAVSGLFVSGLASTPYDVAVGGTDFYYPANATLNTLESYWNSPTSSNPNNNADWSSAKSYIPEKPWNLSDPVLDQVNYSDQGFVGGGGGASSCITYTGYVDSGSTANQALCGGGYPKPTWQSGFGNDTVRDLPDVSLFGSDASNYSFTAICAFEADCAVPNGGPNSVSAPLEVAEIGGTSVSAPSMAGIMALVVQKTKTRQGQANNVLYPLSKQTPSAFHDIAVGTNTVDCAAGSPDCGSNGYLTGYNATVGYDLATGLGSIDAAVLVNHWSNITQAATTTTLSITPASAAHGTALSFTVNVTGGPSGGDIVVLDTSTTVQNGYVNTCSAFPCTFTYAGLPGGSYQVSARYAGSVTYASSTSNSVPVTITPESSEVAIYAQYGQNGPMTGVVSLNGQTLLYGGLIFFSAVPVPAGAVLPVAEGSITSTRATGTITVTDNGAIVAGPLALDVTGQALFQNSSLPVGKHSLVAIYSGDASYSASNSTSPLNTPMVFTVGPTDTSFRIEPFYQEVLTGSAGTMSGYVSGITEGPVAPTGTATFTVTSATGVTTVLPPASVIAGSVTITVPASDLATGNNTVTATYSGDSNYQPAVSGPSTPTIDYLTTATQVDLLTIPNAPVAGQPTTIKALVVRDLIGTFVGYPTGNVALILDGTALAPVATSNDGQGDGIVNYTTSNLSAGVHTVSASYSGDAGDLPSSNTLQFIVAPPVVDFTISGTPVTLAGGSSQPSGTSTLTLTLNYPAASVTYINLGCSTSVRGLSCTASDSVIGSYTTSGTGMVTVSAPGGIATLAPHDRRWRMTEGGVVLCCLLPMGLCVKRKRLSSCMGCLCLLLVVTSLNACGSSVASSVALSAGSYSVTVTGTLGSVSHEVVIPVTVQ